MVADIVSAYVVNNTIASSDLPSLIKTIHQTLGDLGDPEKVEDPSTEKATAAQIRKSITPDALISFEDGKSYKTLKRHLTGLGLSLKRLQSQVGIV